MPYIKKEDREIIDPMLKDMVQYLIDEEKFDRGQINYIMTSLLHHYIHQKGLKYKNLNDAIGIVECVKQEFYRKIAVPYEEEKIIENKDIGILE